MEATPDWDLYRSFLAVMDAGSLSGAARQLNIAQPTVGRHVEALEAALGGAPLFTRSPGGLRPTETARALEPHARAMAVAADALIRTASGEADSVRGSVRVTASEVMGAEVLPAILTDFRETHPQVSIEMVLSNKPEDLLRRESDIAVRMVRPTQEALLARRVGSAWVGLFAHRRYVERHGAPDTLWDEGHNAIGFDREPSDSRITRALNIELTRDFFDFRSDSDLAQLAALRAGFGIGVAQIGIAARQPDLVRILPDAFAPELPVWIVMHEDLRTTPRCRAVFDALAEALAREAD
jgi:DNA-binding transcriptional LysR family regulator